MSTAESLSDVPEDVQEWLHETYTPEGVVIWLRGYNAADEEKRARLLRIARMDGNCS